MPPANSSSFFLSRPPRHSHSSDDSVDFPHRSSRLKQNRSTLPSPRQQYSTLSSPKIKNNPTWIFPGKRGKVVRLILVAVIMVPPIAIFLLAMLPFILIVTAIFTYSVAWLLYWTMAGPMKLSHILLHPRRVLRLNRVVFLTIYFNLSLVAVGISLARYRFWTMKGSPYLITDVHYNHKRPHIKMDIHIPKPKDSQLHQGKYGSTMPTKKTLRPVIVFIYGGAWSSGSRLIYTLVGACLQSMGYVVMIPDYSIFPSGTISEMEEDVKLAIQWTHDNCKEFGGDPQQLYLMGHSAGAHLCSATVLKDSIKRIPIGLFGSSNSAISSSPILTKILNESAGVDKTGVLPRLRGMILCSGVFDIGEHYKHESSRGVEQISAMGRVMGNSDQTFRFNSPTNILQELLQVSTRIDRNYPTESQTRHQNLLRNLKSLLPVETLIIHGDQDTTVPYRSSTELYMELKTLQLGSSTTLRIIPGMKHEEPTVALMATFGRRNPFMKPLMDEISQFIEPSQ